MPLCTRSEVYIRLVCPGIGLSQGAADDARRQGAGLSLNTQLVVSLLSKGLWVGLSLLVRNTASLCYVLQAASLEFCGRLYTTNSDSWSSWLSGDGLRLASASSNND